MNDGHPVHSLSRLIGPRTLGLLASQLHHHKDKSIRRNAEQSRDSSLATS